MREFPERVGERAVRRCAGGFFLTVYVGMSDSGGVAEVIRHGENGFLIPVGDSDALAERLDELLADDAKRSAFGAQAKRDAEATFLAEQMTRKIEKLYLEARK